MRIWLITLLLWPMAVLGEAGGVTPATEAAQQETDDTTLTWVDSGVAYATDQVQALTVWMDDFFGDPTYDLEQPDSLLRLDWENNWDEQDSYKARVRLRGKLQLPKISKRLNLIFSGEDGDKLGADDRHEKTDVVGLQYSLGELNRSRVDLTLDAGTWDLRPGVRYRNQGPLSQHAGYRYTQQVEYKNSDGFYTTAELNLDRVLDKDSLLRWSNEVIYGEETDGVEWRTRLSLDQRLRAAHKKHQFVIAYFASIQGVTDPQYVQNYRVGVTLRRQVYRPYFFVELEPSYNLRRESVDQNRSHAWNFIARFELVLQPELIRKLKMTLEKTAE
ncbi:MAG: hypothetical protein KDI17_16020 [Halioglobus sp.]|nr:hypothetical protein [Halioglobus sp.]